MNVPTARLRRPPALVRSLVLVSALACGPGACGPERAPADVRGIWTTEAAGYEDRAMRIGADSVWFGIAADSAVAHPIRGSRSEADGTIIEYGEGRTVYLLRLQPRPDGTLVLRNQPRVVWWRAGSSPP